MNKLMNYTKFGTRWGVSGQYIGRLARRKIFPTIGGKIDVAKADETMKIQGIRGQRKEPLTSGDAGREMPEKKQEKYASKPNLYEAKAQHEILKSELTELELRKKRGELVEVELVLAEFGKFVSAVRSRLLSVPTKIAQIAAQKPAAAVQQIVNGAIKEALNEFRHYNPETGECRPVKPARKARKGGPKAKTATKKRKKLKRGKNNATQKRR